MHFAPKLLISFHRARTIATANKSHFQGAQFFPVHPVLFHLYRLSITTLGDERT